MTQFDEKKQDERLHDLRAREEEQLAEILAKKYGVNSYRPLREMLANEKLDIVDVCTGGNENGSWHFEPAMEALEAGKHVLSEKPVAATVEDVREILAACRRCRTTSLSQKVTDCSIHSCPCAHDAAHSQISG